MCRSILTALVILFALSNYANAATLRGGNLKSTLQGRVLNLATQVGTLPIRYRANGTMSGNSAKIAKYVGFSNDRGRWWVSGAKLCQKWQKLFDRKTICYRLSKSGNNISWSGGGRSGSARLSN